jgi:hypothetical protein
LTEHKGVEYYGEMLFAVRYHPEDLGSFSEEISEDGDLKKKLD